jgi:starch synthase
MYSQAYGSPPIVSPVGGLKDSVIDVDEDPVAGSGFVMTSCDSAGFADALDRAFDAYSDAAIWERIQRNGMTRHFGWEERAQEYVQVYERALVNARR